MNDIHYQLREIACTLDRFCIVEIALIVFFSWMCYDLIQWYKEIMTVELFTPIAFWGAITGLIATIFASVQSINRTNKDGRNENN